MLAITGMQFHDLIGTFTQQDVELDKLFMDVAVYNQRVMGGAHMETWSTWPCRTALAHAALPTSRFPPISRTMPRRRALEAQVQRTTPPCAARSCADAGSHRDWRMRPRS